MGNVGGRSVFSTIDVPDGPIASDCEHSGFGVSGQSVDEAVVVCLAGLAGGPPRERTAEKIRYVESAWPETVQTAGDLATPL